jgi:hypothetical protein
MHLISAVTPEHLIATLGLPALRPDIFANSLRRYEEPEFAGGPLAIELQWVLNELGLKGIGINSLGDLKQRVLASQLHELVDEWLETGRDGDGREFPYERNVFHTAKAIQVVERCASDTPLRLMSSANRSEWVVVFGTAPARSGPSVSFYRSGTFEDGLKEAGRLFTGLIMSDWKESICKCRYRPCGRYFFLGKPRRSYRHGTFCCREHQSHASADACIRKLRTDVRMQLIETAARELLERGITDSLWQDDANRKRLLAEALCHVIARKAMHGFREEVKANWVTRNRKKIEQRRLELSDEGSVA